MTFYNNRLTMLTYLVPNSQTSCLCSFTPRVLSCLNIVYMLLISKILLPVSCLTWSEILICYHVPLTHLTSYYCPLSFILSTSCCSLNNLGILLSERLCSLLCFKCCHSDSNVTVPSLLLNLLSRITLLEKHL